MKQVLVKQSQVVVEEIPAPGVEAGMVLVEVARSCISAGTEMSGIRGGGAPLWKRALLNPAKVMAVFQRAVTEGPVNTVRDMRAQREVGSPTGYAAAGTVLESGRGVEDLRPGDPVACAGALWAHHAEVICVPRNLVVPVPAGFDLDAACTVTLGAIALQGVRRAGPTLGECFVVIGMGILGQLTTQILKANGCRVIGCDLDESRLRLAQELGMHAAVLPGRGDDVEQVARLTDGLGADGVVITAATSSDAVVSAAFRMCRKKGRVVLVGDVGLHLNREDFYKKELDFFISSSYGPGRYDRNYEERNLDYPAAYVRWTENRNMGEYLRLLAEGKVKVAPLIQAAYPIAEAARAYEALKAVESRPLMVVLTYPAAERTRKTARVLANPQAKAASKADSKAAIGVAVVGAGGFATDMHLPNLRTLSRHFHIRAICDRVGTAAVAAGGRFGADVSTTDFEQVLGDPAVACVLITTRHNLHARMTLQALRAGKHVLVEKPLALTREELEPITAFFEAPAGVTPTPVLLTGFNRRFSPFARRIHEIVAHRSNPMILNYRMNAGYIPLDNWVHTEEGGGRNRGEACHIYDLFTYLTGSKVSRVDAHPIRPATAYYARTDNFVATITFEDGSVATLTYTALGSKDFAKESLDVFTEGKVLSLRDYRILRVIGSRERGVETAQAEKGHLQELEALAGVIREGGEWPIPLWQLVQATEISFRVERALAVG